MSLIVAIAENNVIGKDNQLLWHLSDDLKRFKKLTTGNDVIMGKNTYLSLPVKPLPNRKNIILTRSSLIFEGCIKVSSIEEAIEMMDSEKENFVIGGGSVYKQILPHIQKMYITRVNANFEGDTFFPDFDPNDWILTNSMKHPADEKHSYSFSFEDYERKTK
ncbi:MAG: dihydrofolate reductase [Bacteroidetes bacterium]|nr:dihydrofolate reductase [Bacteroidales bacterium]NJO70446.1 dihydrofolate reductase [Bacteroidota bacterium]